MKQWMFQNGHTIIWSFQRKPEIEEILGHKYKGTYHEPVNSVEFVPLGVNKAKGIEVILDHTGISREDSYAFGDE